MVGYFAITICLLLWLLLRQRATVRLEYWRDGQDDQLRVRVYGPLLVPLHCALYSSLHLTATRDGPVLAFRRQASLLFWRQPEQVGALYLLPVVKRAYHRWLNRGPCWPAYRTFVLRLLSLTRIESLRFDLTFSTGDATNSCLLVGGAWALISSILMLAQSRMHSWRQPPEISVTPLFGVASLRTHFDCILAIRLTHIIHGLWTLLWQCLRLRKEV